MKNKKKAKKILNKIKNADEQFVNEDDEYIDPDFILESNGKLEEEFEQLMKKEKSIMDKKEALECIKNWEYERVPKKFYKDKSIVLEAVKSFGYALEYADESLKKDKSIVLEAFKQNGSALVYADESFRKDKSIVLAAVKSNGFALQYADESLQKDPDIIKAAKK